MLVLFAGEAGERVGERQTPRPMMIPDACGAEKPSNGGS